ncbi:class I SAM-dependent methyltransferase [Streptomyces marincola]|uniref:class I SAM-dependent methyltransferase n=1 Tax=Streptomyces marincola TaxID=2878388 RepID=UPI001CF38206|nr:methyltransferase domain-containing protein [Streptomyces marincola]UCM87926.1 methyltransferase domain-containing protein [Streptomyces marincola]
MTERSPVELNTTSAAAIDGRHIRAVTFHGVRMEYVRGVLGRDATRPPGRRALVVGGIRGELARGLAGEGLDVTAVDPSEVATRVARERAEREGVAVTHLTGPAERLDLPDAAFDLVYCADTFEITDRLDDVLAEAARVLVPGGVLIYDTVNRTPLSRLIYLGAFQGIPQTRIVPPGRYAAARLRRPADLSAAMERHGLRSEDVCGFRPTSVTGLVKTIRARKSGAITTEEMAPRVAFRLEPGHRPLVTYLGRARRR